MTLRSDLKRLHLNGAAIAKCWSWLKEKHYPVSRTSSVLCSIVVSCFIVYGAGESAVGVVTNRGPEFADGEPSMTVENDLAVRRALELAGVEFTDENSGGPGVRLRKRQRQKQRK
jgi:hypothetical protein